MSSRFVWMPEWSAPQQSPIGDPTLSLPVIYLYRVPELSFGKRQHGEAMSQDGRVLNIRSSTAEAFLKTDLLNHARFRAHYPGGYQTLWVDDPDSHAGVMQARRRRLERSAEVFRE